MQPRKIVVTCAPQLSTQLKSEVEGLGLRIISQGDKHIETFANGREVIELNYKLRCANKVLISISDFDAQNADELYSKASEIPWESWIRSFGYFSIDSFVRNDSINDNRFANQKLKDAIVDRFRKLYDKRPDTGPEKDKTVIYMHWVQNSVKLYFDSSGETLAKHGYRELVTKAPLLENLAAALVYETGYNGAGPFLNPMCGSGTLAIEAALIASNIYPGSFRNNFGFMHLKPFIFYDFKKLKIEFDKEKKEGFPGKIYATDYDMRALKIAQENAKLAGVEHLIHFAKSDFKQSVVPKTTNGIVILNPEYGIRLGEEEKLEPIYKEIGDFFKNQCQGYKGYIFTGNLNLAKKVGLRTKRRIPFFNGKIECRLLEYEIF